MKKKHLLILMLAVMLLATGIILIITKDKKPEGPKVIAEGEGTSIMYVQPQTEEATITDAETKDTP